MERKRPGEEQDFLTAVQSLVGEPCWGVAAGGCTGSRFILSLGSMIERRRPVENDRLQKELRTHKGEHGLHVGCAAWRLSEGGSLVTAWTDDASADGPLVQGLQLLRGTVVTSATATPEMYDLRIGFDERFVLTVFCDQVEPDLDNYTVWIRDANYEVVGRSVLDCSGPVDGGKGP